MVDDIDADEERFRLDYELTGERIPVAKLPLGWRNTQVFAAAKSNMLGESAFAAPPLPRVKLALLTSSWAQIQRLEDRVQDEA